MSDFLEDIGFYSADGENPVIASREGTSAAQAQADAQAALAAAEASAAALLADLEAKDHSSEAPKLPSLPSRYAPGEGPRDPRSSVAAPSAEAQVNDALSSSFKPVDPNAFRKPTNTSGVVIDFAQKIKDAQKFGGNH